MYHLYCIIVVLEILELVPWENEFTQKNRLSLVSSLLILVILRMNKVGPRGDDTIKIIG